MADSGRDLFKNDFEVLLSSINEELIANGVNAEILLCGGAVFVLEGFRETTRDIDCLFKPSSILNDIQLRIAKRFGMDSDWINIDVNNAFGLFRLPKSEYVLLKQFSNLSVYRVSDRVLLAMKVLAARERADKNDMPDTLVLLRRLNIRSYDQALNIMDSLREELATRRGTKIGYLFSFDDRNKKFLAKAVNLVNNQIEPLSFF